MLVLLSKRSPAVSGEQEEGNKKWNERKQGMDMDDNENFIDVSPAFDLNAVLLHRLLHLLPT